MTNDRTRVVTMAQELAEALPEQMSRLGNAEDLLRDLIAFYDKSEAYAVIDLEFTPDPELTEEFEDIVDRARKLIGKRKEEINHG